MVFSHKAFMLCYDVFCGKDVTIDKKVPVYIIELVHNGLVRFENRDTEIAVFGTEKLCKLLEARKLPPPQKLLLKNSVANEALRSSEASTETAKSSEFEAVGHLIARSVKHSSAPYVAVVNGKQPRKDPMIEYTKRMSPVDCADFWQAYGKLSDDEKTAYRRSFASASRRGQ